MIKQKKKLRIYNTFCLKHKNTLMNKELLSLCLKKKTKKLLKKKKILQLAYDEVIPGWKKWWTRVTAEVPIINNTKKKETHNPYQNGASSLSSKTRYLLNKPTSFNNLPISWISSLLKHTTLFFIILNRTKEKKNKKRFYIKKFSIM